MKRIASIFGIGFSVFCWKLIDFGIFCAFLVKIIKNSADFITSD